MDNALWALVGTIAGAVFALAGVGLQTFFTYPGAAAQADDRKATRLAAELLLLLNPEDQFAKPAEISVDCAEIQRDLTAILTTGLAGVLGVASEGAPDPGRRDRGRETAAVFV